MTTTPVPHTAVPPTFGQPAAPHQDFQHPDATDQFAAQQPPQYVPADARQSFGQSMGKRSTEFKNALIAGGVGVAVAFLAAGFGLGYWAGDAGSSSGTPQSGFSQMGGSSQMGGGQMSGPGGMFGGQTQNGTGTTPGTGTGTGTTPGTGTGTTSGTGTGTTTG